LVDFQRLCWKTVRLGPVVGSPDSYLVVYNCQEIGVLSDILVDIYLVSRQM